MIIETIGLYSDDVTWILNKVIKELNETEKLRDDWKRRVPIGRPYSDFSRSILEDEDNFWYSRRVNF